MKVADIPVGTTVVFEDGVMAERISSSTYKCFFEQNVPSGMIPFASLFNDDIYCYLVPHRTICKFTNSNWLKGNNEPIIG